MPDKNEEVTATETQEENADAEVSEEESAEAEESEEGASHSDNEIDHEAELKKEREAREKAERALADKRFKFADKKRKEETGESEGEETDEDRPLTAKELQKILAEERQSTQALVSEQKASEHLNTLTDDSAERDHVMDIYRNRNFPEYLSVQDRIEEAFVIANRKRLVGERNEAMRALLNKGRAGNNSAMTHRDSIQATEPKMSPQDKQAIKEAGFVWNGKARRHEKKLQNGQTLVRDPKTGSVSIQQ